MSLATAKAILNRTGQLSLGSKRAFRQLLDTIYADVAADTDVVLSATSAGAGITGGVGTVYDSIVSEVNGIITTSIFIDLTGLSSGGTAGDIIGKDATAASHLGQITAAVNGTIYDGVITCVEAPAGGEPNIDLFSADEATGTEDAAVSALTETALLESSGDWTVGLTQRLTKVPVANQYLYLVAGDATDAVYTAGQFVITLYGREV